MDAGYAVVTEADLNYITGEMATFQLLEEGNDEPQTPEGRTAIQRIYSAPGERHAQQPVGQVEQLRL